MIGEWEIPTPVISKTLSALPVARMLRPFTDVAASLPNRAPSNSMGPFTLGMAWVPSLGRMVFSYDDDYTVMSCATGGYGTLGTFLPDLTGAADVVVHREESVLLAPASAVQFDNGKAFVEVQTATGIQKRPVNLGESQGVEVEIESGLSEGDVVVINQR